MKHKATKQILSLLLAVVMLLSLMPATTLTAFAEEKTEITEIKTVMSVDTVPKAGMEVTRFIPNVPDGEPYQRDWDGTEWYDSNGVKIAPTINHHYDIGYEFEAGRTYYADYEYTANDGYIFPKIPPSPFLALIPLCSNMRSLRDGTIMKASSYVIPSPSPVNLIILTSTRYL